MFFWVAVHMLESNIECKGLESINDSCFNIGFQIELTSGPANLGLERSFHADDETFTVTYYLDGASNCGDVVELE